MVSMLLVVVSQKQEQHCVDILCWTRHASTAWPCCCCCVVVVVVLLLLLFINFCVDSCTILRSTASYVDSACSRRTLCFFFLLARVRNTRYWLFSARNKNNMASTSSVGRVMRRRPGHVVVVVVLLSSLFVNFCVDSCTILRSTALYVDSACSRRTLCVFFLLARAYSIRGSGLYTVIFCTRVNLASRTAFTLSSTWF
jgi:hypothetical protein